MKSLSSFCTKPHVYDILPAPSPASQWSGLCVQEIAQTYIFQGPAQAFIQISGGMNKINAIGW